MPLPVPEDGEPASDFIERCMSDPVMIQDFDDEDQRLAVCQSQWESNRNAAPSPGFERRIVSLDNLEIRQSDQDPNPIIRGHAAIFDTLSDNLGGFREKISSDAFNGILDNDVRALFNHDPNHILGRTKSGTLRIGIDETGLNYELNPPDTTIGRDLLVMIERGDITQSSFGFRIAKDGDQWDEDEDGRLIRTITRVAELFDVSPVTYPAYPDASVGLRSLMRWKISHGKSDNRTAFDRYELLLQLQEIS